MNRGLLITLIFSALSLQIFAQTGEISGKIKDENGEGLPFATVAIVVNGTPTGQGTLTDFDGNYSIKPLDPGKYDVQFSYTGYGTQVRAGVLVNVDKTTFLDVQLKESVTELDVVEVIDYKVPLIDPGQTSSQSTITKEDIENLATRDIQSIASQTAGVYSQDEGSGLNIRGGRGDATEYFVDGVRVRGSSAIPADAIEELTVVTGGIPAKYGDVTGGVVSITTRGPSGEWSGGFEYLTSQITDPYNYNLLSGTVNGPVWKKRMADGEKKTIIGFLGTAEYKREMDRDPAATGVWRVKKDKLDELKQFPLIERAGESGFEPATTRLVLDDLENVKAKSNADDNRYSFVGKFDIRPKDNFDIKVGGTAVYRRFNSWIETYQLMNSVNNPQITDQTYRAWGRFTHRLSSNDDLLLEDEESSSSKSSFFQNAYYSVQFDYEKFKRIGEDASERDDVFSYTHIGEFNTLRTPTYDFFADTDPFIIEDENGNLVQELNGWVLTGFTDTAVTFNPTGSNPDATRYTSHFYELLGAQQDANGTFFTPGNGSQIGFYDNLNNIEGNGGLINGARRRATSTTHNIWFNPNRQFGGYGVTDNDKYSLKVNGAFDILKPGAPDRNKHNIEFGFEFEQRVERVYSINPEQIWNVMRQLSNQHIVEVSEDFTQFSVLIDGQTYAYTDVLNDPNLVIGPNDTLIRPRNVDIASQTTFDRNLRNRLGLNPDGGDFVNVDQLSPDFYSLDMFSADELFNQGNPFVFYQGYDPYGRKLGSQPSYNSFFQSLDAQGNETRLSPAYRPIYTAAYIQDKFQYRDLNFNVGVRIDRFDANQKTLRDKYSIYRIHDWESAQLANSNNPGIDINNIDQVAGNVVQDDWAVYVDNVDDPSRITGFRDGDRWYDIEGNPLESGDLVAGLSGGSVSPFLTDPSQDIKLTGQFNPDESFVDYKPQVNVMPRLQFSFNLTDKSLFFAHYDILTQRPQTVTGSAFVPQSISTFNPLDYLFFIDNISGTLNNPDLRPEKTIDFQLGFKQKISQTSAITISAFYKEFKNLIQIREIVFAYPRNYTTFDNIDFGTAKGFDFIYDLRPTGNFSAYANYSLQFAEGTGSDPFTQFTLVNLGLPNLRNIRPLGYDARHTINLRLDYRYASGKDYNGPTIKGKQILADAGANLRLLARSGTPYTPIPTAVPEAFLGGTGFSGLGDINTARLPWIFRADLQINKRFTVNVGGKPETDSSPGKDPKELRFNVYVQIQNLFDTRNLVNVYSFTGNPEDDGYLGSAAGQQQLANNIPEVAQSIEDLYTIRVNDPDNYTRPRTIRLGVQFDF